MVILPMSTIAKYLIDVSTYGFLGLNNRESKWMGNELPSPSLNISAFQFPGKQNRKMYLDNLFGYNWTDPRTGQQPFIKESNSEYMALGQRYSSDYVNQKGSCQPIEVFEIL